MSEMLVRSQSASFVRKENVRQRRKAWQEGSCRLYNRLTKPQIGADQTPWGAGLGGLFGAPEFRRKAGAGVVHIPDQPGAALLCVGPGLMDGDVAFAKSVAVERLERGFGGFGRSHGHKSEST